MSGVGAIAVLLLAAVASPALALRQRFLLDEGWRFELDENPSPPPCKDPAGTFPIDLTDKQCLGLAQVSAHNASECVDLCCADAACQVYQYCQGGSCSPQGSCWIGQKNDCDHSASGWISRARNTPPPPPPGPPGDCSQPQCSPSTDDSTWRLLDLPHDFVVEGTFTPSADMAHGYLPFGIGWYRKHFSTAAFDPANSVMWLDFDGIQTQSTVWLNGQLLGTHASGYTPSRYFLNASMLHVAGDNLLAVKADATHPDGWWYDGGGIYRHVWLTVVATPGPFIAPWGVYAPATVEGPITVDRSGVPHADSALRPAVELWNNASAAQAFALNLSVLDGQGALVASLADRGSIAAGAALTWTPSSPIALQDASLWHLVPPPATPALYTLQVDVSVGGQAADRVAVTFGVRQIVFDAAKGFMLNGIATKILGTANHQDFAGLGVAIPDHLQEYRITKLREMGVNGWRTAHNPPNEALLDAADRLGFLVWDENHRNGQYWEVPKLIKRDRNHPSVVIWSICNEVLCNTNNSTGDALAMKALMHELDPLGFRPVSANQNGYIGPNTPLDVQGFDYATGNYDQWHSEAPNIPSISSETSSAVSDRCETSSDATTGHVASYDNTYPGWGQSAQQAWGGVGMKDGQGILTRPFISGGWTWTGHDYRGEPTPYSWPDKSSHFGIVDLGGNDKERTFWYRAWFARPSPPLVYVFPHWNWPAGTGSVDVWVYSNADSVELLVNGVSAGVQPMPQYAHAQWSVPYAPGAITALAYVNGTSAPVASMSVNTTGAPAALRMSVKYTTDGATLVAGCRDAALVLIEVVDAAGLVVPYSNDSISVTVSGPATYAGAHNGDPAASALNTASTWPAYHGLLTAMVRGGDAAGTVTVSASAPGLAPAQLQIAQVAPTADFSAFWCLTNPTL